MTNRLPIPEALQNLIEKREDGERRGGTDRRQVDLGPFGGLESASDPEERALEDRRVQSDRRARKDRRGEP